MTYDERVEAAAKAIYEVSAEPEHGETWEGLSEDWKENLRTHARKALEAAGVPNLLTVLAPFTGEYDSIVSDENGWTEFGLSWNKDRIVDWFGPSDFYRARKEAQ